MADPSSMAVVAFVTSWCTPTSLFLFLNLMIGALVFSSRFTISAKDKGRHSDDHRDSDSAPSQIHQAPSLLNRVKSFNFSQYCNFDYPQYTQHEQYTETDHAPPLTRAPSVLHRLKSVNFTQFRFDRSAHTPAAAETVQEKGPDPGYTAQPLLQRLKSINFWHDNTNPEPNPEPVQRRREPPPLARVPSFLARVKSINFSLYGQDNEYTPEEVDPVVPVEDHHVQRVNSDTQPSGGEAPSKLSRKMRKSASHKSAFGHFGHEKTVDDPVELRPRPESVREGRKKIGFAGDVHEEEEEEEEHIDSKADDFINQFRQQLKLQRLDSIVRYKEMLTRAHAAH